DRGAGGARRDPGGDVDARVRPWRGGAVALRSTAPGKVLWSGEYAVLDGAPAIVMAVDRRARAWIEPAPVRLSPFLEAARAEIAAHHGSASPATWAASHVRVDSAAPADAGRKLGLGSSAASTVAAVA